MKTLIAVFFSVLVLLTSSFAKESKTELFFGITSPLLDNGLGFDLGLRSSFFKSERIGLMGQIGFGQYRLTEFLSGRNTTGNYSGLMLGPSITFLKDSKLKPTLLILGGIQSHYQKSEGVGNSLSFAFGANTELNFSISTKLKLGILAQSPGFLGLRCSYII
ncbi:MAG: hypothetical protein JXQ87_09710 [Bacteroidia bacterium]